MNSGEIKKIKVCNFRSISEIEVNMNRMNILVAKNDAGKSSFIEAVKIFYKSYKDFEYRDKQYMKVEGRRKNERK